MDRLIRAAWRAFWVGLGASAVLVGQSVLSPGPVPTGPDHGDPAAAPMVSPPSVAAPAAARRQSTDPLTRCSTVANVTRCS